MIINNKVLQNGKISLVAKFLGYGAPEGGNMDSAFNTNSDYYIGATPAFNLIISRVKKGIEESEQVVYANRKLVESVTKMTGLQFLGSSKQDAVASFFKRIDNAVKASTSSHDKDKLLANINKDIEQAESMIKTFGELKQILEFEEKWETQQLQSHQSGVKQVETDVNRETWLLLQKFQQMSDEIPAKRIIFGALSIDFRQLKDQVSKIPKKISRQIEKRVVSSLETDTELLRQDLSKAYEILEQQP